MNEKMVEMNYKRGLWTKEMVKMAVRKGVISKESYERMVGEAYETARAFGNC